jgi:hypothetical protein
MSWIDLDKLKADPNSFDLYQLASRRAGATTGTHNIGNLSQLEGIGPNLRLRLAEASLKHEAEIAAAARAEKAAAEEARRKAAAAPPPPPPARAEPQISMAELEAEQQADLKRAADQARAVNRLNEYAAVGLEDTQANAELIKNFVENSPAKGYWSFEIVEVAIKTLGNRLTWKPKVVETPPAPPQEPVEVLLGTLKDGSKQLPLDAVPNNHHTKDQLTDWLARTREATGRYVRPRSSFGSKF